MSQIAIIGAGAWGTAISIVLGRKQRHEVRLWAYEDAVRESIAAHRVNELFLPGHIIPECVHVTGDLRSALDGAGIVVSAMSSQHCRLLLEQMSLRFASLTLVVREITCLAQSPHLRVVAV